MKKIIFYLSIVVILLSLTGCNAWEERKAEKRINNYYYALIKKDYKKAFNELRIYDDEYFKNVTSLSREEAEQLFLKKIDYLEKNDYQITDFKILEAEYEDGHSFWHHVLVQAELDGEIFEFNEVADIWEGKLIVSSSRILISKRENEC